MSIQNQSRFLLMRRHKNVINREKSMLARTAAQIGVNIDPDFHTHIQGKTTNDLSNVYDRSGAAMS